MRRVSTPRTGSMPAGGTMGGPAPAVGPRPGKRTVVMGDEVYLWVLVVAEVSAVMFLRSAFSRYHGG